MQTIRWLFWNDAEDRPRFILRFALFVLIFAFFVASSQTLLHLLAPDLNPAIDTQASIQFLESWAISQWMMLVALLLTLIVIARWVDRRPMWDYGFHFDRRWWQDFGFGLFLGGLLMLGIFMVEWLSGWLTITGTLSAPDTINFGQGIAWAMALFIATGILEELLTRGYLLHNLAETLNYRFWTPTIALVLAWIVSSSLFGLAHAGNPNATAVSTASLVLAGLFLGLGYVITGNLAIPIGLHITWNFFEGNVFGFPVSGTAANAATFVAIKQRGPELWTGGAFGPEAGLISIIAIGIGALLVLAWVKWRYGQIRLQLSIPQPPPHA